MIGLDQFEAIAWLFGNWVIAYDAIALVVFVIGYYSLFDPTATTAGKMLFRFMVSLVGVLSLSYVGIFFFPVSGYMWYEMPPSVEDWWPMLRLAIYLYVAFTITSLAVLLVLRKWFPKTIKSAPDRDLVQVRRDTGIIDTHEE